MQFDMFNYMLRAIFFDFYGVWVPDLFMDIILDTKRSDEELSQELQKLLNQYYVGLTSLENLVGSFKVRLNRPDLDVASFELQESHISPEAIQFIQFLHSHFIKVGILASVGQPESKLLHTLDSKYMLFENITDTYTLGSQLLTKEVFVEAFRGIGEPRDSCLIVTGNDAYQKFAEKFGIKTLRYSGFPNLKTIVANILEADHS